MRETCKKTKTSSNIVEEAINENLKENDKQSMKGIGILIV